MKCLPLRERRLQVRKGKPLPAVVRFLVLYAYCQSSMAKTRHYSARQTVSYGTTAAVLVSPQTVTESYPPARNHSSAYPAPYWTKDARSTSCTQQCPFCERNSRRSPEQSATAINIEVTKLRQMLNDREQRKPAKDFETTSTSTRTAPTS